MELIQNYFRFNFQISVTSSQQKAQVFTNPVQTSAPQHQIPMHTISNQQTTNAQQTSNAQQTQPTIMRKDTSMATNANPPMFIELPKVAPNQQLFSLNTLTNQIVQLSPGLTTAALGPMERLLIVPAGINSQQLLQCLNQGQIHFNNIGQAAPSSNDVKTQAPSQPMTYQLQSHAHPSTAAQANKTKNIVMAQPVVVVPPKAKKTKAKKPKADTQKKSIVVDMKPTIVKTLDGQSKQVVAMKTAQVPIASMAPSITTTVYKSIATQKPIAQPKIIGNSPQTNQTIVMTTASQAVQANEALMMTAGPRVIHQAMIAVPTHQQHQPQQQSATDRIDATCYQFGRKPSKLQTTPGTSNGDGVLMKNVTVTTTSSTNTSTTMPPLISVSSTAPQMVSPQYVPRVQTIQLTPQKQQLLKNVQMQIQNLSGRLQNKQLLSSIRPDVSPSNPLCNKPLPTLTNINAMNDMEIYQALQRLFIEQQNILATGKIIPTLPAHGTHSFSTNVPMTSPISFNASCTPTPTPAPVININVSNAAPSATTTVAIVAASVASSARFGGSSQPRNGLSSTSQPSSSITSTTTMTTMATTTKPAPRADTKSLHSPHSVQLLHNGSPTTTVTATATTTTSTVTPSLTVNNGVYKCVQMRTNVYKCQAAQQQFINANNSSATVISTVTPTTTTSQPIQTSAPSAPSASPAPAPIPPPPLQPAR